ncbi:MAG: DNA-processing protein DprA [Oleiphilaceae bacterium]|nr:DNA-processing protein DprA [Oleiphilaceae bacterium]
MLSLSVQRLLALRAVKGFGLKSFASLYRHFGSLECLFAQSAQSLEEAGCSAPLAARLSGAMAAPALPQHELELLEAWLEASKNHHLLSIDDPCYPPLLREIFCPPPLIYVKGSRQALLSRCVSVIGARKASAIALAQAHDISASLAQCGWCVVSGLAMGVDAAAHEGALSTSGLSIAVLATGIDRCYPKRHEALAERLCTHGALISEMPLGTPPRAGLFPRRNRLVAGLSHGTVVVEAGLKSGSLITASMALEENRELMAMPGLVSNAQARGCHALIKQGAALIEHAEDVVSILGDYRCAGEETAAASPSEHADMPIDQFERQALRLLSQSASMSFDEMMASMGLTAPELSQLLLGLEIDGWLASVPGGYQLAKSVNF